jgi:CheY-like chemotaxis protein
MVQNILIVDDSREVLKFLRSTLESLKNPDLKFFEAFSGEEALLESTRHKIDLLVTDYKLPGMTGVELMHRVRSRNQEVKTVIVSGLTERKAQEEMHNAGALAVFTKPVPVADFLDTVERGLGLVTTMFKPEPTTSSSSHDLKTEARRVRISDLLANFRQDFHAVAVFLISDRGRVQARAGGLGDSQIEASLISTLTSIHVSSVKIAQLNHQKSISAYHVFSEGENDIIFIPVDSMYSLLVAGQSLAAEDRILESVNGVSSLRKEVERTLRSIGATGELRSISPNTISLPRAAEAPKLHDKQAEAMEATPSPEMIAILKAASGPVLPSKEAPKEKGSDDFWDKAAEQYAKKPASPRVMSLEEARKKGIFDEGGQ